MYLAAILAILSEKPVGHYYSPYSGHTMIIRTDISDPRLKIRNIRFDGYTYLKPLQPGDTVEYGRQY